MNTPEPRDRDYETFAPEHMNGDPVNREIARKGDFIDEADQDAPLERLLMEYNAIKAQYEDVDVRGFDDLDLRNHMLGRLAAISAEIEARQI